MKPQHDPESWKEWRRHVLAELKRLNDNTEAQMEKTAKLQSEVSVLKVKAGIFGALAGGLPMLLEKILAK